MAAAAIGEKFQFFDILADVYSPSDNPTGFVSLGVAENTLMHPVLLPRLHAAIEASFPSEGLTYGDGFAGIKRLRHAMSTFFTRMFQPVVSVKPDHIIVTAGCTAALEHLAYTLTEPGEFWLLGRPYYGTFILDMTFRTGCKVLPVSFGNIDPFSKEAVACYEKVLAQAQKEGKKVRGLILCHPHNPLGRIYPTDIVKSLMRMCERNDMHFVSDEIYALSTFLNTVDYEKNEKNGLDDIPTPEPIPFVSALAIDTEGVIDPRRVHVVWGMSKDFGANGIRIGSIISQHNAPLRQALRVTDLYSSPSSLAQHAAAAVLEDTTFCDAYIKKNQELLGQQYRRVICWAREWRIEYKKGASAGFFVWLNLGKLWKDPQTMGEKKEHQKKDEQKIEEETIGDKITNALFRKRIFLASGKEYGGEEDGWFRLVFSVNTDYLLEGLRRVEMALDLRGKETETKWNLPVRTVLN